MGSCVSIDITTSEAVNLPPTAKVINIAGDLREYSSPVSVFDVLGGDSAASFLCSSDRLYCDEHIPALDPEELLQPGQIYFVLHKAKLRFPLSREDMAALAVRASSALGLSSETGSRRSKKIRWVVPAPDLEGDWPGSGDVDGQVKRSEEKVLPGAPPAVVVERKTKRSASVRASVANRHCRCSKATLSTISELVE